MIEPTMPRQNPLPQREQEICRRVREARRSMEYSRVDLAKKMGLDSSILANVELQRTALRADVGVRLCNECSINYRWLATGKKPRDWFVPVYKNTLDLIDKSGLYSAAYDDFMAAPLERYIASIQKDLKGNIEDLGDKIPYHGIDAPEGLTLDEAAYWYFERATHVRYSWLPDELKGEYVECLFKADSDFFDRNLKRIEVLLRKAGRPVHDEKKDVDASVTSDKTESVKAQWPGLLERLKKATKARGVASALARELDVPLASVSRWLGGKREPSGDIALKLLRWVERQEAK